VRSGNIVLGQRLMAGQGAWGATLFVVSDMILAAERFAGAQSHLIDDWVWLTYGPAQMLIVYSAWAARWVVGGY